MLAWTYANIWDALAAAQPERAALVHGDRSIDWQTFERRAGTLAATLREAGLRPGSKLGIYLPNTPDYMIAVYAALKISVVPFNVNYRYGPGEIVYLLDNADAEAVVFDIAYAGHVQHVRRDLPQVQRWIAVHQHRDPLPAWAIDFDEIVSGPAAPRIGVEQRSGDDRIIIYTGGTTGKPKGVIWRQADLIGVGNYCANVAMGLPPLSSPDEAGVRAASHPPLSTLVACPLMHGTGLMSAIAALNSGGMAATLPGTGFDPVKLLDEAARLRVARISIVGMAFAGPLLDTLDAHPGRWDLSAVRNINSSGTMWSIENKLGLLRHMPHATLTDTFASSEGFQMATSHSTAKAMADTGRFVLGPNCAVFAEDGRRIEPGSGEAGLVAVAGHIPLGYYKDPEKTARTFPVIEGRRWSMPGDWATVEADGTLALLGRGSQCINTGGEKVFPEEVEEALKRHEAVRDAAVIGLPDPRFGERICAVIELERTATNPGLDVLAKFVRSQIASFKVPRSMVIVPDLGRAPNGKLDYAAIRRLAIGNEGIAA
ncbi:AMP-binding protein [Sphingomonas sp. ST-64]|uniref:AMP-binding protein n=1 Tax=Sphingomonas plantiphila TaxID=3163295 RepID=A0ABW8YP18_9SPHN